LALLAACGSTPPATQPSVADAAPADTGTPANTCHLGANRCDFGRQCVRVNGMPRCVVVQDIDRRSVCAAGQCAAGDADASCDNARRCRAMSRWWAAQQAALKTRGQLGLFRASEAA
jgi:hypothetical protein